MILGAQTHFSQGWSIDLLKEARRLGATSIRDSIRWGQTEVAVGVYDFSHSSASWLDAALAAGTRVTLVFPGNGNSLYDGGHSVYTDHGRAAFAKFIAATLRRFPGVDAIEIGNEYIGQNSVNGPIAKKEPMGRRDEFYAEMLAAVDRQLDQEGISVSVIGGAAHSIPVDWFSDLKANGAFAHMDAVAIHPYTTAPEQFEAQIAVLRKAMGDTQLPIAVTEFGQGFRRLDEAPAYLAKMVAIMAAAHIDRASWYALARQKNFPNMELYDPARRQDTPAGKAFAFFEQLLGRGHVRKVAVNDFTYLYSFGSSAAVIWGDPRALTLGEGVRGFDLAGTRIENFAGRIDETTPIVLIGTEPLVVGENVKLGASATVADSFDQFDVANNSGSKGAWSYFAQSANGKLSALKTMGGGVRAGEGWTPYLGHPGMRPLFIGATSLSPVDFGYRIVERFTSRRDQTVSIQGHWDVADGSVDGIRLTIKHGQTVLHDQVVFDPKNGHVLDLQLSGIALKSGDTIDFIVGSNETARGSDRTQRRITITADRFEPAADAAKPEMVPGGEMEGGFGAIRRREGTVATDRIDVGRALGQPDTSR
jgi:hypothetical protein